MIILNESISLSNAVDYEEEFGYYNFTVGDPYQVVFKNLIDVKNAVEAVFYIKEDGYYDDDKFKARPRASLSDAGKVFATVGQIIIDYVKMYRRVQSVFVKVEDNERSRLKLYERLCKLILPKMGFKELTSEKGNGCTLLILHREGQ